MRILTRYILREVTSHALLGIAVFTFILFTRDLGTLLELVVRNSAPLPSAIEIFLLTLPLALTYTIPMGVLVGILIGLSRLAADSEITAMRASGVGVWNFLKIVAIFAVSAWLLACFNSAYAAPRAQATLAHLEDHLKTAQASFEVQPRVFYEGFPKLVLYVQDVKGAQNAAIWKGVFIADISNPSAPRITLAREGVLVSEGERTLHLHLTDGATHEASAESNSQYQISTFLENDVPIDVPAAESKQEPEPLGQMGTMQLRELAMTSADPLTARLYWIEFHRRLALPFACLVLALVGIPLGLSSKKGGKSSGFVLTVALVFTYYAISLVGVSFAKQGKISPAFGAWLADIVFLAGGAVLLWLAERRPFEIGALRWRSLIPWSAKQPGLLTNGRRENAFERASSRRRVFRASFPMILDDYVLRDFAFYFALILSSFLVLLLVFTLFELLGDILRNQVSALLVGDYLLNVSPYFLYNIAPLSVLLAVLITFGVMQRSNEMTAIKATGISIYRIILPVVAACAVVAVSLFFFDQFYLPYANKRQDALRNEIKGKPPQTYLSPDRKWIFGSDSTIYYYQLFDSDRDQFGRLSVFQFNPKTFSLTRRIYADRAQWDDGLQNWIFTQGWERSFEGPAIENYRAFDVTSFAQLNEPPAYFKKEVKQSSEMNYEELRRYIRDLQQSGFDVVRLRVQLQKKLAYPAVTLVMAVLAVPFALSAGKRGAITGVATAVVIALVYMGVSSLFEKLGEFSLLPPLLAAWSPDLLFALAGGYLVLRVPT